MFKPASSSKSTTFVDLCLNGDVDIIDIDDFIDEWHDSAEDGIALHDYLGLSEGEYALYVEKPTSLPYLISAHRFNVPLNELEIFAADGYGYALAARAKDASEAQKVMDWLRKTGRI